MRNSLDEVMCAIMQSDVFFNSKVRLNDKAIGISNLLPQKISL